MKFLTKVKWREVYAAVRKIDDGGLRRKRGQLRKNAKTILKRKALIVKRIKRVRVLESDLNKERREYEILVNTITRKLTYEEPKEFRDRQKVLDRIISMEQSQSHEIEF